VTLSKTLKNSKRNRFLLETVEYCNNPPQTPEISKKIPAPPTSAAQPESSKFQQKRADVPRQKAEILKFSYPFTHKHLRHSPRKKSPEFRAKAQLQTIMKGVVLPLRTMNMNNEPSTMNDELQYVNI